MASVSIRRRETKSGPHFQVRFRLGGRTYPVQHGGSFPTLNEARTRRDLIAGELAAGRNPAFVLDALLNPPEPARVETLREIAPRYEASRIDREGESRRSLGSIVKRIIAWGGDRDPNSLTWGHCQEFVGTLSGLKPGTVRNYFDQFRLLLDFAGCDPNPARDKRVKLPKMVREEASSPTAKQYLAILDNVPKRWLLPFVTQEQCAMHIGEVASLAWGDVDVAERKFLLRYANVKGAIPSRARNVQGGRVGHGGDRGDLSAGGSHRRAKGVPGTRRAHRPQGDGDRLQERRHPALQPQGPAPPPREHLAPRRRRRPRTR
jgi:hypothetical protein